MERLADPRESECTRPVATLPETSPPLPAKGNRRSGSALCGLHGNIMLESGFLKPIRSWSNETALLNEQRLSRRRERSFESPLLGHGFRYRMEPIRAEGTHSPPRSPTPPICSGGATYGKDQPGAAPALHDEIETPPPTFLCGGSGGFRRCISPAMAREDNEELSAGEDGVLSDTVSDHSSVLLNQAEVFGPRAGEPEIDEVQLLREKEEWSTGDGEFIRLQKAKNQLRSIARSSQCSVDSRNASRSPPPTLQQSLFSLVYDPELEWTTRTPDPSLARSFR